MSKSPQSNASKILQKKERKSKAIDAVDQIGSEILGKDADRDHNDSFEKYYNKDLDLEEGKLKLLFFSVLDHQ